MDRFLVILVGPPVSLGSTNDLAVDVERLRKAQREVAEDAGIGVWDEWTVASNGFSAELTAEQVNYLLRDARVAGVRPDAITRNRPPRSI